MMAGTKAELVRLRNIATKIGSGATPKGGENSYKADGITLIRSLNVYDFRFQTDGLAFIDKEQADGLSNVIVEPHDLLLNITGASVARCCMAPRNVLPARVNQHVSIVRVDPAKADPYFVLCCINSPRYKTLLLSIAQGGATREALTKEKIENFEIPSFALATQRKIAAVLGAYDGLIENNRRRIEILEEMARRIYQEWVVHFRFPGHEKVKLVPSPLGKIPAGWQVKRLAELADINATTIKKGEEPDEILYVDISSVATGRINKVERLPLADAPGRARRVVRHGDIVWSCVRPNRKSYSLILNPLPNLIVSTGFAVITPKQAPFTYLYLALTTDDFVGYLTNHATGAAYPAVTGKDFENAQILHPAKSLLERFHVTVEPCLLLADNLARKNDHLRRTRDLLLPKLISGELDVEGLEIE